MPDHLDDLWEALRAETESWLDKRAPSSFDNERLEQEMSAAPCMSEFPKRLEGMTLKALRHAYANHLARDAKTKVKRTLLQNGTKYIRQLFRAELTAPALFAPDGLMRRPVIYQLESDVLVPLKYLSIRDATRTEQRWQKEQLHDLEVIGGNLDKAMRILDGDVTLNGTFGECGVEFYEALLDDDDD